MGYVIWPDGPAGDAVKEAYEELQRARDLFGPFKNGHEGYAVIKEELDELWDEVRNNKRPDARDRQIKEARQIAAMALRFIVDLQGGKEGPI